MKEKVIETKYGKCLLKNETIDTYGYPWVELYNGENLDHFVGTLACSMDDLQPIIDEQIDELLGDQELPLMSAREILHEISCAKDCCPSLYTELYRRCYDEEGFLDNLAKRRFVRCGQFDLRLVDPFSVKLKGIEDIDINL